MFDQWKARNPHQNTLLALSGPILLFALPTLLAVFLILTGRTDSPWLIPAAIGTGLFGIFVLSVIVGWLWGRWQMIRIQDFLDSERDLLRWNYYPEEWREIKEAAWQEKQEAWLLPPGCLAFLFGLIGLIAGGLAGLEEGLEETILWGGGSMIGGALAGALIGGAVTVGNYLAARREYHQVEPDPVVLAPDEIYADGTYFKADGVVRFVKEVELEQGVPTVLRIVAQVPPWPRYPDELEWLIVVPPRLIDEVEAVLPRLTPSPGK